MYCLLYFLMRFANVLFVSKLSFRQKIQNISYLLLLILVILSFPNVYAVDWFNEISIIFGINFMGFENYFCCSCVVPLDNILAALEANFCWYCMDKIYVWFLLDWSQWSHNGSDYIDLVLYCSILKIFDYGAIHILRAQKIPLPPCTHLCRIRNLL